nr:reverse transcriptase domain-containing protein [Tanacetum cinerariifolium]
MMADQRTMAELLQAPTEGYEDAIIVPTILTENFELKHGLLNLVTSKQFFGHDKEDPHAHIRWFNKITSTMRYPNVPNTSIKLMIFPFSIEGAARMWLEKEPPRSILTWEDLVSKFINQFFPPSKTTNLCNEITNFQQRFDESFCEAWDHFKDLLYACPHHGFIELHQLDTFYDAINPTDQDSLNSVAGGNFLDKMPQDCLRIIEKVVALTDAVKDLLHQNKTQTLASEKVVEDSCVTCGVNYNQGNTRFHPQVATNYRANQISPPGFPPFQNNQNRYNQNQNQSYNQNRGNYQAPIQHPQVEPSNEFSSYKKITETSIHAMQNQITNLKAEIKNKIHYLIQNKINNVINKLKSDMSNQTNELQNLLASYFQKKTASTSGSRPLPSNTIANPRGDLKTITTRSGVSYDGPPIPHPFSSLPKVVKRVPELTKDMVQPSTKNIQPPVVQTQVLIDEPVVAPKPKPTIPYPSRVNKQKLHALLHMPKFSIMFKSLLNNKEKLFDLATTPVNENCSAVILKKLPEKLGDPGKFHILCDFLELVECLALGDLGASINLMPLFIWKMLSLPELTPTRMILELADRSTTRPAGIAKEVFVKVGKTGRALIDVYGEELTLRVDDEAITFKVGQTLKYSYNDAESINRIDVIDVACKEHVQEVLGFSDNSKSGNPTLTLDPIIALSSPSLTPFEGGDFILEEIEACLTSKSIPPGIDDTDFDLEGDIHTFRFQLTRKTKKRPALLALIERLPTDVCLSVYAMLRARSKVYTDHLVLKYLLAKQDAKPRLLWWILLLQEFDVIIRDKNGAENLAADHLSRLENPHQDELEKKEIIRNFPLETLGMIAFRGDSSTPWFADIENYHARNFIVKGMSSQQKKNFFKDVKHYVWDDP